MSFCPACGSPVGPDDAICPVCGSSLLSQAPSAQGAAPGSGQGPDAGAAAGAAGGPVPGAVPGGAAPTPPSPFIPSASPLKLAWTDFKLSGGKLSIILKLALFQFVPGVGSLVQTGYAYTWGKEVALGRHLPMPTKIIRPGVLDTGLYAYGVSLIVSAVVAVALLVLSSVFSALHLGFVFALLLLAAFIVGIPFLQVVYMRTAITGRVRSGANLKRAWDLFASPGKMGSAFAAAWAPAAISGVVTGIVWTIGISLIAGSLFSTGAAMGASGANPIYMSHAATAAVVSGSVITMVLVLVAAFFVTFFVATAASIVASRAFGYWIRDFHPDTWPEYLENSKYYMDRAV